jgi:hypothetical protein
MRNPIAAERFRSSSLAASMVVPVPPSMPLFLSEVE